MKRIEEITWEDHFSTDAWAAPDDDFVSDIHVTSLGYVLKETKTKVVLMANVATNGQIFGTITILKKTIKTRAILREATQ